MPGEMDDAPSDAPSVTEMDSGNPCWEDLYDDDCAMSNAAAAAFVAGEWIKSLPCAKGLDEVSLMSCYSRKCLVCDARHS
jgi:hypothetical protein